MVELERSIIGSLLIYPERFPEAQAIITAEDFSMGRNAELWLALERLSANDQAIDAISLATEARVSPSDITPYLVGETGLAVAEYCSRLKESAAKRRLLRACERVLHSEMTLPEALATLNTAMIQAGESDGKVPEFKELVMEAGSQLLNSSDSHIISDYGIDFMDRITGGIRPEYTIIAGRPGEGKSALGRQIAYEAIKRGTKTVIFTPEMTGTQVASMMFALDTNIAYSAIRFHNITRAEQHELTDSMDRLINLNHMVTVDDTTPFDVNRLAGRAKMHIGNGAKLIIVDYLQLLRFGSEREERLRVKGVSGVLRDLSKTQNVAVMALCQLRRRENENTRPTLSDLKESGDLEQDAVNVFLLYRPKSEGQFTGDDELIIAKQRFGEAGFTVNLKFNKRKVSFEQR